jgi:hypothetical protein
MVYTFADGWAPLCQFLRRPAPKVLLPHLSTRKAFSDELSAVHRRTIMQLLFVAVLSAVVWRFIEAQLLA